MKKKILVVDDESLIRFGLHRALEEFADVDTADSVREADAQIKSRFYDVCLLDIFLPDANGLDLMRRIGERSPETKIIMMSAYADEDTKRLIQGQGHRFLEKPLDLSEIRELLQ